MIRSCSVVLFVIQVIVVYCDDQSDDDKLKPFPDNVPRHCWHPPREANPRECCPIPQLYSEEEFSACGIEKPPGPPPSGERPPGPPPKGGPPHGKHGPHGRPDCSKTLCLLKNRELLNDDESINFDKLANFIDDWAKKNPDFEDAIKIAKEKCITDKKALNSTRGPPDMCDADKVLFCMTTNIFWNCKLKEDLPQCTVLKSHMDECKEYFQ